MESLRLLAPKGGTAGVGVVVDVNSLVHAMRTIFPLGQTVLAVIPLHKLRMCGSEVIALLGRRDQPTDGVEDYCRQLGRALEAEGRHVLLMRLPWPEQGWPRSLAWL